MKIFVKSAFVLLVLVTFLKIEQTTGRRMLYPEGKNHIHFDRLICRISPGVQATLNRCVVKHIDRYHLKIDISANIIRPLEDVWLNGVIYYKYNTWQKVATEYWDNFCDWMAGSRVSFFLTVYKPFLFKYSNINHTCPLSGLLYFKADNISLQDLAFPQIAPAGDYRLEVNFYKGDRKKIVGGAAIYGQISDHRIEVV